MKTSIIRTLIKLGANVNDHDIFGFTPLHYAVNQINEGMITTLLEHGANPNSESRSGFRPLTSVIYSQNENVRSTIYVLIQQNAKLTNKGHINTFRTNVEAYGSKELACKVREAHPREKGECEKCTKSAEKKCSACGLVSYCTTTCQKMDWKFHKITCQKNKRNRTKKVI